ncbi:hypothetical protein [Actinomadura livida]|uniref:DUF1772 domain-containing protein n=1 Tax=Actinomadura livida TaxID=79909 RepID=A0A7W7IDY0_9ACTN|nr:MULTISPECIES: hypothetical protein [Actinomadura]MBB4774933.1 hypothetical protein [Actinomadura catellatispora]GGU05031.1 hypothetical protein GCM10010208_31400 [Actinomadura livida]
MSHEIEAGLAGVLILATSVWTGGFAAIAVVARVTARTLAPGDRVAFFRALGRAYGVIGSAALALALGSGAVLVAGRPWDGVLVAAALVAAALVLTLLAGVVQARRMTRLRHGALAEPGDERRADLVRRGARGAGVLRAFIGALALVLIALGAVMAT